MLWQEALKNANESIASEIYLKWLKLRYHYLSLKAELQSLLIKLRQNYFLALITNGTSNAQWEKIDRLKLEKYFDVLLISGDLKYEKPDPRIFQHACKYLNIEPQQCIMVGDKLETDILGGIEANVGKTVWIPLKQDSIKVNDPKPDYVLDSVIKLPQILPSNELLFNKRGINTIRNFGIFDLDDSNSSNSSEASCSSVGSTISNYSS